MNFSERLHTYKQVYTNPGDSFAKIAKKDFQITDGLINYVIAAIFASISVAIASAINMWLLLDFDMMSIITSVAVIGIGSLISGVILSLVLAWLYHFMAGILGGKGKYANLYFAISSVAVPLSILSLLQIIPCLGSIINIIASLYAVYIITIAISKIYELDMLKSVAAWLVPAIVVSIALFVLAALGAVLFFGPAVAAVGG
ncbi:MAG: Yip1 family protein [Candidatus Micrarchaeota archaeon]